MSEQVNSLQTNSIDTILTSDNSTIASNQTTGSLTMTTGSSKTGDVNIGAITGTQNYPINFGTNNTTGQITLGSTGGPPIKAIPRVSLNGFCFPSTRSNFVTSRGQYIRTGSFLTNSYTFPPGTTTILVSFATAFPNSLIALKICGYHINANGYPLIIGHRSPSRSGFIITVYNSTLSIINYVGPLVNYIAIGN
jgi:hypothetical protein